MSYVIWIQAARKCTCILQEYFFLLLLLHYKSEETLFLVLGDCSKVRNPVILNGTNPASIQKEKPTPVNTKEGF